MDEKIVLSIIVTAYNEEKYIVRCLDSLLFYLPYKYEIVVIDDGSCDLTGKICDEYAEKNLMIKVIHKKNEGLVVARDIGLLYAKGAYIAFVDGDDWVDPDFFDSLIMHMERNEEIDIAIGPVKQNSTRDEKLLFRSRNEVVEADVAMEMMAYKRDCHWFLWGKVYRRGLLEGMAMTEAVDMYEDLDRSWKLLKHSKKVFLGGTSYYHYFVNEKGLSHQQSFSVNRESWRVFRRALLSPWNKEALMRKISDDYVKVFVRQTWDMYFWKLPDYEIKMELYQKELRETMRMAVGNVDVVISKNFPDLTNSIDSLKQYYDTLLRGLRDNVECLADYDVAYVYGTGALAQYIACLMEQSGVSCKAYIVSNGEVRKDRFAGRPVCHLNEIESDGKNVVFLLALKNRVQEVVKEDIALKCPRAKCIGINMPDIIP